MKLSSGTRLGPYEIAAPLGAGGMGEVYRARDTRLDRDVAIKILASESTSPDARQRFEREARTISQLSHPHICPLFDVGEEGGVRFLVMQLLDGETLAARLGKATLPPEVTIRYAAQMADALAAAHRAGIVHRDLKPANVMVTKSGVRLLDFGLAKASGTFATAAVTQTAANVTREGAVAGTVAYMAPEVLEGQPADERSDIYGLGAVIHEMATGQRAFRTTPQTLSPPALDRIVRSCLAVDPDDRWQSARDIALQLRAMDAGAESAAPPRTHWLPWAIAALAAAVATVAVLRLSRAGLPAAAASIRFSVLPPPGNTFWDNLETVPVAIAPDGLRFGFLATDGRVQRVWIRSMSEMEAKPVAGTEGARSFFWSPDSRSIGFFAAGKLKRVDLPDGVPFTICDLENATVGYDGTWSPIGDMLFAPVLGEGIYRVPASGGTPILERSNDVGGKKGRVRFPSFLSDGRRYVYHQQDETDATRVMLAERGQAPREVLSTTSNAQPMGFDAVVYARDGTLVGQRFDADRGAVVGAPFAIAESVRYFLSTGMARFAASSSGTVVYHSHWDSERLVWLDRTGRETSTLASGTFITLRISPDGRQVAFSRAEPRIGTFDVWIADVARGGEQRLTSDARSEVNPLWLPDGASMFFAGGRGQPHLVRRTLSSGVDTDLYQGTMMQYPEDVTRDGKTLIYAERGKGASIWTMPVDRPSERTPLIQTTFVSYQPRLSPDGKALAFVSNETGRNEVYVSTYPPRSLKTLASSSGGTVPRWSPDGRELFFLSSDRRLMSVAVQTAPSLVVGAPAALFPLPGRRVWKDYDVAPDGKRLLAIVTDLLGDEQPLTVVTNVLRDR